MAWIKVGEFPLKTMSASFSFGRCGIYWGAFVGLDIYVGYLAPGWSQHIVTIEDIIFFPYSYIKLWFEKVVRWRLSSCTSCYGCKGNKKVNIYSILTRWEKWGMHEETTVDRPPFPTLTVSQSIHQSIENDIIS